MEGRVFWAVNFLLKIAIDLNNNKSERERKWHTRRKSERERGRQREGESTHQPESHFILFPFPAVVARR